MIELQRKLLGDSVRNSAFAAAIEKAVHSGHVIIDAGSGTGFLSMLAARRGAKCHLIEAGAIMSVAKTMARANGFQTFSYHHSHSSRVTAKIRADVIISETLGNYAYEENIIETVTDVKRFLKPGGTVIPSSIRQYAAPVISEPLYRDINIWDSVGFDVELAAAKEISLNNMYVRRVAPEALYEGAASIRQWDEVDLARHAKSIRKGSIRWRIAPGTTIYGFCLFWECTLIDDIMLSTSPFASATHWDQIVLPLMEPLVIPPRASLALTLCSDSRPEVGIALDWDTAVLCGETEIARQKMSTRKGVLE